MTEQNHPTPSEPNPFFETWTAAFEVPPFGRIAPGHFMPAFERAFAEHDAEIAAVTAQAEAPTLRQHDRARWSASGRLLERVAAVFFNLASADTNDALLAIEREIGPKLAAHNQRILQNDALFQRIDALHRARDTAGLTAEQKRVLDRYHKMYRRAGAGLDATTKKRLAEIAERLAMLGTSFSQNVLADEQGYTLTLETEEDLAGLPDFVRAAARAAAAERGMEGKHVITLSRSSVEPFLQFSVAPRPAREGVPRLDRARRQGRRDRQQGDRSPRRWRCAPSAPSCSASRPSPTTASTTPWRRRRTRCATCSTGSGRRRARARSPTATPCRSWCARRAATSPSRRGTGATTPRSCARSAATSTRRR